MTVGSNAWGASTTGTTAAIGTSRTSSRPSVRVSASNCARSANRSADRHRVRMAGRRPVVRTGVGFRLSLLRQHLPGARPRSLPEPRVLRPAGRAHAGGDPRGLRPPAWQAGGDGVQPGRWRYPVRALLGMPGRVRPAALRDLLLPGPGIRHRRRPGALRRRRPGRTQADPRFRAGADALPGTTWRIPVCAMPWRSSSNRSGRVCAPTPRRPTACCPTARPEGGPER
ncbi:Uncharacterised protein [Pseudomonas aeruginosa]|nr:Uncharacterised protein [Pseudomonas aeruginosa]